MTLDQLIKELQTLRKKNPQLGSVEVVAKSYAPSSDPVWAKHGAMDCVATIEVLSVKSQWVGGGPGPDKPVAITLTDEET